jgi:hypothetical protein
MKKLLTLLGLTALVAGLAYVLRAPVVGDDSFAEPRFRPEPPDKSEDVDSFDEA